MRRRLTYPAWERVRSRSAPRESSGGTTRLMHNLIPPLYLWTRRISYKIGASTPKRLSLTTDLATATTTALLDGLRDPCREDLWRELDERFRPIIVGVARRAGLSANDADEVAQQALAEFVRDYRAGKYDRERGRLRTWMLSIARHRIVDLHRERSQRRERRGESALVSLPDGGDLETYWKCEHEQRIAELAWNELRTGTKTSATTLEAFQLFAIHEVSVEEVAQRCHISREEVYRIKHRLTKRLREIVQRLNVTYEDSA